MSYRTGRSFRQSNPLSRRTLSQLDNAPAAGSGVHHWLFVAACRLQEDKVSSAEQLALLRAASRNVGRLVPDREIASAITSAQRTVGSAESLNRLITAPASPAWPKPDYAKVRILGQEAQCALYDLWERSPVRFDEAESHTEEVVDVLFPGDPLLCIGESNSNFATRRREVWRAHLARYPFIVPNPMLDVVGLTQDGQISQHTLSATARRIYLVTEFDISLYARDGKTLTDWVPLIKLWDEWEFSITDAEAVLIMHLTKVLPLVLVVYSGGKSLHALVRSLRPG